MDAEHTVIVTEGELQRMADIWASEAGRAPTRDDIEAILAEYVREEVLFREAERLGLGVGDTVVRRRLAQKMRFLIEESDPPNAPTEAELREAYEAAPEEYAEPARVSFIHVPFSFSPGGDTRAEEISASLTALRNDEANWRAIGDPFMLSRRYERATHADLTRLFGDRFADAVFLEASGKWSGPIRSRLAEHLVRIEELTPGHVPEFERVRDKVATAETEARWRSANEAALAKLMKRYTIILDEAPS